MDRVDRPSSRPPDGGRWRVRQWWPAAVSLALYIFLTFLEFGLSTSLGSGRVAVEDGSDGVNQIWFLEWTQYAIAHGHNPFFSQWQSFPTGLNVLSDTSMIALGTVFSPITTLFGPVVTWNVLVRLAVIVSAFSMCLVLRRWTRWWPAAFVGGAVYGYSAYITFNLGHLFLVFVPLPPLMFLLLHETLVRQQWRPVVTGGLLGAACAVQYLVSSEILTTTVLMGAGATVLYLYLLAFRSTLRTKLAYMGNCLIYAIVVGGVLLSVPVLFTLFGREHLDGVPQSPATLSALHGDLFSPLAPGSHEWHSSVLFSSVFDHVASTGETLYLGCLLYTSHDVHNGMRQPQCGSRAVVAGIAEIPHVALCARQPEAGRQQAGRGDVARGTLAWVGPSRAGHRGHPEPAETERGQDPHGESPHTASASDPRH